MNHVVMEMNHVDAKVNTACGEVDDVMDHTKAITKTAEASSLHTGCGDAERFERSHVKSDVIWGTRNLEGSCPKCGRQLCERRIGRTSWYVRFCPVDSPRGGPQFDGTPIRMIAETSP